MKLTLDNLEYRLMEIFGVEKDKAKQIIKSINFWREKEHDSDN